LIERRLPKAQCSWHELDAIREDLNTISKQVNTCVAIASRYLRSLGKRHFSNREVRVNQVLTDLQTLLKHHPAVRGGHLAVKLLEPDMAALINSTDIVQILLNLTTNAFQSSVEDQTVQVAAEIIPQPLPVETLQNGPAMP